MGFIGHAAASPDMPMFIQDLRYSARELIKSPGFTLTAVLSLALGIGATTTIFSVIYPALLNPYPFAAPRIMRLSVRNKDAPGQIDQPEPGPDRTTAPGPPDRKRGGDRLPRDDHDRP